MTRGDLFVHWEAGAAVFDRELVDADWALNNGNWMWLSCSCLFYQYFRVYGPVSFGKKYDKEGAFIRHYLPVLKVGAGYKLNAVYHTACKVKNWYQTAVARVRSSLLTLS